MRRGLSLMLRDLAAPDAAPIGVRLVRARDASGAFAIQPGHADLVAALVPSLVEWVAADGGTHFAGVPGGVLRVSNGDAVEILARRLYAGDTPGDVARTLRRARESEVQVDEERRRSLDRLEAEIAGHLVRRLTTAPKAQESVP